MKILNKIMKFVALLLIILMQFLFIPVPKARAATSPSLGTAATYSILAGTQVTNTGSTTISGDVGIYPGPDGPGTTGFGTVTLGGAIHDADGAASDVWIFKSASDLILTGGDAVKVVFTGGGQPCNVWWRVVSTATFDANSSLVGNILADTSITLAAGASLNGRALARTAEVTLSSNSITGPTCAAAASSTSTSTSNPDSSSCPPISNQVVSPSIIESRRVDADSIFISWGPYSGTDRFNVRYGPTNGNWLYNTDVTGFSTTINALSPNQPIWIQVAARNDCSIGTYGEAKLIGGGGQVLGASTDTLAATGSNDQFVRYIVASTVALLVFLLGKVLLRGNETS